MNISPLSQAMLLTAMDPALASLDSLDGPSFLEAVEKELGTEEVPETAAIQTQSLEDRLKARYPGLVYHVFDGSSRYWRSRQDFPFHKLYQPDLDGAEIESWRPTGPNPDPLDARVQRDLSSIPPGSKAVIIHPKVQQRMEEDPAYAEEIYRRIEAWFTFDRVRNEAILPGSTMGMSQAIAIGEDGSIANVQACSSGGGFTYSKSGSDEDDFWTARTKRHRLYMQQVVQAQILHSMGLSGQFFRLRRAYKNQEDRILSGGGVSGMSLPFAAMQSAQTAIAETMAMMEGTELREALGDTVAGVSVDEVFEATRTAIANRPAVTSITMSL